MNKDEEVFIEAYMRWQSEQERGDPEGKKYFEGGLDAIIMLAQMLGYSEEWIQNQLITESKSNTNKGGSKYGRKR